MHGLALLILAGFFASSLGWGSAFLAVVGRREEELGVRALLGVGALVYLGGILNLGALATAPALISLMLAGCALLFFFRGPARRQPLSFSTATFALVVIILAFTWLTQVPPRAFNFHDDFQKYLAHTVRMLQTGTVHGSPLSAMGSETLGGLAFLQSFLVALLPLPFLNGMDSFLGFFLCLLLADRLAASFSLGLAPRLLCVLSVFLLNPQYVNTSALYLGAAFVLSLGGLTFSFFEEKEAPARAVAICVGLVYAALVALKALFLGFVALHFLCLLIAAFPRGRLGSAGWAGGSFFLFLLPWLLVHRDRWGALGSFGAQWPARTKVDPLSLFSLDPLFYGDTALQFTSVVLVVALAGAWSWRQGSVGALVGGLASASFYLVSVCLLAPRISGQQQAIRYFAPVLIGSFPLAVCQIGGALRRERFWPLALVLPLFSFLPSCYARVVQAIEHGSILAFSATAREPGFLAYNEFLLSEERRQAVRAAQLSVPEGEAVIAWMNSPFLLDFRRNQIFDGEPSGVSMASGPGLPRANYILWEHRSPVNRARSDFALQAERGEGREALIAARTLAFVDQIVEKVKKGDVIFDNGQILVARILP